MDTTSDPEIELLECELNLSHALLDIAGPKPLAEIIANAQLGYEKATQWIGRVHDPTKLRRISAKLDRLRERLAGSPTRASASSNLRLTTAR